VVVIKNKLSFEKKKEQFREDRGKLTNTLGLSAACTNLKKSKKKKKKKKQGY
jgi:hypothetical protein